MQPETTDYVRFPDSLVDHPDAALPRIKALAARWARAYRDTGKFPEPATVPLPAGSLVFTESVADLTPSRPGVRLYLVSELRAAVLSAIGPGWRQAVQAFEDAALAQCWGALAVTLEGARPDTVAGLRARLVALDRCVPQLESLRYLGYALQPVTLGEILAQRFAGLTAVWQVHIAEDPIGAAVQALEKLAAADRDDRLDRLAAHLAELAATDPRVRNSDELDADLLRAHLTDLDPARLEQAATGSPAAVLPLLYTIDRSVFPPG
jgi:hypothetical protein